MPTFVSDEIVSAIKINLIGKGALGYAEVTANQGTFTTEVDLTGLTTDVTVAADRLIRITGYARYASSVANDRITTSIKEGSTTLNIGILSVNNSNLGETVTVTSVLTPSAGAHTYKLTAVRSNGTGNITMQAAAGAEAYILVEDLGDDPNA